MRLTTIRLPILFFLWQMIVSIWKNFVFLLPYFTHLSCDFWYHNISSWQRIWLCYSRKSLSSAIRDEVCITSSSQWTPLIWASNFLWFLKMLPNTWELNWMDSSLTFPIFISQLPLVFTQVSPTIGSYWGWESHVAWKWKTLFFLVWDLKQLMKKGLLSELCVGRNSTSAWGKETLQSDVSMHLLSFFLICTLFYTFFLHMNKPPRSACPSYHSHSKPQT